MAAAAAVAAAPTAIHRASSQRSSVARFYITTAIDYANGDPHLGHAFEKIGADALARYHRLRGDDVHFLMGMDEHGQKVAQSAAERGIEPQQLVDQLAARFETMWHRLAISNDQFIRTTDPRHKAGVRALIEHMLRRSPDDFYEKAYEGWYCVGCELFKRENEIADGKCVLHPTRTLEWAQERNWFFRLSRYQGFLTNLLTTRPDFLRPESRRNELLALLESGLEDISITRSKLSWAIPFPEPVSTGEQQGTWVWFDALPNYLTATGYPTPGYEKRWPAQLHVVGKDITRLHALIWPAMLESAGLPLPEHVFGHGFAYFSGQRFSKSAGVTLDLDEAIDRYGADAFRYFLLREIPFDNDGSFTWDRLEERYTADLANAFGNLASRTIAMIERYCGGVIPGSAENDVDRGDLADAGDYARAMERCLLHEALRIVWRMVARGNEYVDRQAPWKLAKDPSAREALERTLATLARQLVRQAVLVQPFMPGKSRDLWEQLGGVAAGATPHWRLVEAPAPNGWRVIKGPPLFPKETTGAGREG
ncbi:MAG TPA: methionine--tRNA ligase [Gemmatimonadaceae bacterium]|nr:methionine--tRNA ligase [Gemmatimonadaceae bacterium]